MALQVILPQKADELKTAEFNDNEMLRFNSAWRAVTTKYTRDAGRISKWDGEVYSVLLDFAKKVKAALGVGFDGVAPKTGFGMQAIHPLDVFGATNTRWDINWGTAAIQNWISIAAPDAGAYQAGLGIRMRDTAQRDMAMAWWGIQELGAGVPNYSHVRSAMGGEQTGDFDVEREVRSSEDGIADFGVLLAHPPNSIMDAGLRINVIGPSAPAPVGVMFRPAEAVRLGAQVARLRPLTA